MPSSGSSHRPHRPSNATTRQQARSLRPEGGDATALGTPVQRYVQAFVNTSYLGVGPVREPLV